MKDHTLQKKRDTVKVIFNKWEPCQSKNPSLLPFIARASTFPASNDLYPVPVYHSFFIVHSQHVASKGIIHLQCLSHGQHNEFRIRPFGSRIKGEFGSLSPRNRKARRYAHNDKRSHVMKRAKIDMRAISVSSHHLLRCQSTFLTMPFWGWPPVTSVIQCEKILLYCFSCLFLPVTWPFHC